MATQGLLQRVLQSVRYPLDSVAQSPSGKAKVCKTFIGGSIPPCASKLTPLQPDIPALAFLCIQIIARVIGCASLRPFCCCCCWLSAPAGLLILSQK
jgi:hypothetical protein